MTSEAPVVISTRIPISLRTIKRRLSRIPESDKVERGKQEGAGGTLGRLRLQAERPGVFRALETHALPGLPLFEQAAQQLIVERVARLVAAESPISGWPSR